MSSKKEKTILNQIIEDSMVPKSILENPQIRSVLLMSLRGREKDLSKLLDLGVKRGHTVRIRSTIEYYLKEGSVKWYQKLANLGLAAGCMKMVKACLKTIVPLRRGLKKPPSKATQNNLGCKYYNGEGVV